MPRKIDISHKTIIFITIFLLSLWVTYLILDLLILLFVALILTSALAPLVDFFVRLKMPKALGIVITYIIILIIMGGILAILLPPLIEQSDRMINSLPPLLAEKFNIANIDQTIFQQFANYSTNIFSFSLALFNNIIMVIFLLVLTFYLLLERENLEIRGSNLFVGKEKRVQGLIVKIEDKLGSWFRGQLFLSAIIAAFTYIGLFVLNLPYALPLAILAGLMEVVPVIGPIVASLPAIALAFTISPVLAGGTAAMYFIIQQMENHIIVPQVMKRAVGLNPLIVILAIAVGSRLLGIGGAFLAVPIVVVVQILLDDFLKELK